MLFQHFGGKLNAELIAKYSRSPNWQNGCFQNLEPTNVGVSLAKMPAMLYKQIASRPNKTPKTALPITPFDREAFLAPSDTAKFIWYGHSVLLLRMRGKTLLIDPMFGPDAAPIAPVSARRFSEGTLDIIDALPDIDLLLLTHDHYDHLDYASIQRLKSKTRQYFVALGVKRHLCAWGIPSERITEFDWWDHRVFEGIEVYFTPSRHFSGRGWSDRFIPRAAKREADFVMLSAANQ